MGDVYMLNGKILSGLPNHAKDIEFDNTGTTLSSTNTEDAIKEVDSNLTANTFSSAVDVTSYTSGSYYTCPKDGYLQLYTGADASNVIEVAVENGCIFTNGGTSFAFANSAFLKKGMKITISSLNGNSRSAVFFPLNY